MPRTDFSAAGLRAYAPVIAAPADLDDFWAQSLARAREIPLAASFEVVETGLRTLRSFDVTFQVLGQWWAHQLDLGHILPAGHVRTALASIVAFNYRTGLRGFEHGYRVFADADDAGLLICTWPHGGRPAVPIRYADEVWTGVEYQVAAHCPFEGMTDEGLRILAGLRARYDGSRRNPYNEIECGDHYSRAMAGFSVLDAWTGAWYDAWAGHLRIGLGAERYPLIAGPGWGEVTVSDRAVSLRCLGGQVPVSQVSVPAGVIGAVQVGGRPVAVETTADGQLARLAEPVSVAEGDSLTVLRVN